MEITHSRLLAQLSDPRAERRAVAVGELGDYERLNVNTIPDRIPILADADREVRLAAVTSLIRVWRALTGGLGDLLASNDEIDQAFQPLTNALRGALRDEDKYVRLSAADSLQTMGAGPASEGV